MIFAREQWLALKHLGKDAACAPDVHFHIVLLPCEHNLWCSVVSRRDIACHLRVLYTCQAEVADFKVAVFVHEDVGRFEIAVHDTSGVDVFEAALRLSVSHSLMIEVPTHQNLIKEVLDELLLQRSRGEKPVEIGSKQFGHCTVVSVERARLPDRHHLPTYISSRGEIKMSLKLITCISSAQPFHGPLKSANGLHSHASDA